MDRVEQLVTQNMRLCHHFAEKGSFDRDQVFSIAMEGLLVAAETFDTQKGVPFGTYASYRIKWKICQWITHQKRQKRWNDQAPVQLDSDYFDSGKSIAEVVADGQAVIPDQEMQSNDERKNIDRLMSQLPKRDQKIIRMRFGLDGNKPMTLERIAKKIGLTRERVRQLESIALKKLRAKYGMQELLLILQK